MEIYFQKFLNDISFEAILITFCTFFPGNKIIMECNLEKNIVHSIESAHLFLKKQKQHV